MLTFIAATTIRVTAAAVISAASLAGTVQTADAQAEQENFQNYCFYENNNINVFIGDMENGFYAHAANRPGNTLYYRRVGETDRYVGQTGAIYTFFPNGDATWSDGRQMIRLHSC